MHDEKPEITATGPLKGLRVLDLSRILAGPTCTQLCGDMGAEIIKIERPDAGDDTRFWGPPYVQDAQGNNTTESAYYLSSNRNKRSITLDISQPQARNVIKQLLHHCDILIENFKVGGLKKYGLSYADLKDEFPQLIYCSISGFGQTGPYASRPGYDFLIQAMGGIMSFTGEPDGTPMKTGVGVADVICGLYASTAILAALHHRTKTSEGQYIDISLLDSQVAWLVNGGLNYLTSGKNPERHGNGHPNIVPYDVFPASDGYFVLAIGNDSQFAKFCQFACISDIAEDERFNSNENRVFNRERLTEKLHLITRQRSCDYWIDGLEKYNVPCGPVNTMEQVFNDPQVRHRNMQIKMKHPLSPTEVSLIGNPLNFSTTPVSYRRHPPLQGEHTDEVLKELLGLDEISIENMRKDKLI